MLKGGDRLGPYEITGQLGEGGWGQVLRAREVTRGLDVAVKVLHTAGNPATRARFLREGRLAAKLSHANVVRILEVGEIEGTPFIAMELVPGLAMSAHLGSPKVRIQRRLDWLVQAARGLTAVHDAGLVHRDVKPANLMIMPHGVVKLIDFGFAKDLAPEDVHDVLTQRGAAVGTPAYMAPEQDAGTEIDHRADQFAWGLVGFALVTGTRLRVDDPKLPPPPALEKRLLEGGVNEAVARVLVRAFRLARDDRFASMREAGDALEASIPTIDVERPRTFFCPRCATQLDAERRCARCDPPDAAPAAPAASAAPPALVRIERERWRFEVRRAERAVSLKVAHVRRDGLVIGFTRGGQAFVLDAGGLREIAPPPVDVVLCATTQDDDTLWVGAEGFATARLAGGAWSLVEPAVGGDIPMAACAVRNGEVFVGGSRPDGGVFCVYTHRGLRARQETPSAICGVATTRDGRAFGVGGTTLFRTSGFGLGTIAMPARAPLHAIASWGDNVFAVGAEGSAIRYDDRQQQATLDVSETAEPFSHVCAAGPALAYATAGHDEVLRRDPQSGTWQKIGGSFGEGCARAIAATEDTVTVVLDDGAMVHGRRA